MNRLLGILVLCCLVCGYSNHAIGAEPKAGPFPCRFDSYFAGEFESGTRTPEGYSLSLLAGGDGLEMPILGGSSSFEAVGKFIKQAKSAKSPPEGAFLFVIDIRIFH